MSPCVPRLDKHRVHVVCYTGRVFWHGCHVRMQSAGMGGGTEVLDLTQMRGSYQGKKRLAEHLQIPGCAGYQSTRAIVL